MKKKLIVMIIVAGMLTGCGSEVPKLSNGEEAVVGFGDGTKISVDEIWEEVKESVALNVTINKIDKKILEEKYADKQEEVDEYISNYETSLKANYVDENGNYDEELLLGDLTQYGYSSLEAFLDEQRLSYMTNLAITDYAKEKVTDKEVKKYYEDETVGDIHCVHILVKPESSSNDDDTKAKESAEKIIKDIKADIKSGTSELDAFKKYEDNKDVTYEDLDYFNKGEMEESFEEAAYALKKNGYSSTPVKTSYGYHVILKVDEKEKEELSKVEDEIKDTLAEEKIAEDPKLQVNAMIELRKENGVEWHDSELEDAYNKYMNYLINQSTTQN